MGNIVLTKKIIDGSVCLSTQKFNLEDLINNEIVRAVFRKFKDETGLEHDEYISLTDIFDDFERQDNLVDNDSWKKNLIKELNELHTSGLSTPDYFTQDLKETRFEKYFRVIVKGLEDGEEYHRTQYLKFFLIYSYIRPYFATGDKNKNGFFQKLAEKLQNSDKNEFELFAFEMGFSLSYSLLDELGSIGSTILENALKNIYSVMIQLKTGLSDRNDYKFYAKESILNNHRDYLVNLIHNKDSSSEVKSLALKLVVLIGNLRESGEDYLCAYNLVKQYDLRLNLDAELALNKHFQDHSSNSIENYKPQFQLNEKNSKEIELLSGLGYEPNINYQTDIGFDDKYIYLFSNNCGLFKIGLKNTTTTKAGLAIKLSHTVESNSITNIVCIKNRLFISNNSEHIISLVDKHSLTQITGDEEKRMLEESKRDKKLEWNAPSLEKTALNDLSNAMENCEAEEYRTLVSTPLFTDGSNLYLISTYVVGDPYSKNEVGYDVEVFSPDTWKCIKTIRLLLDPEECPDLTQDKLNSISQETAVVKHFLSQNNICRCICATNGKVMAIAKDGKMFFFDLDTGRRYRDSVNTPITEGGYDHLTNTFWYYKPNSTITTLKSFKVEGFKSTDELHEIASLNIADIIKKQTSRILEENKQNCKSVPRKFETFLKQFGSKNKTLCLNENIYNESSSTSLYLLMSTIGKGCEEIDEIVEKMDSLYSELIDERFEIQTQLFRSKYGVSVTEGFTYEIITAIERVNDFLGSDINDCNISELYQLLWIVKLTQRFILTIQRLNLTLSSIIEDSAIAANFVSLLSKIVIKVTSEETKSCLKTEQFKDESEVLWNECVKECRIIENDLLSLASESTADFSEKVKGIVVSLGENSLTPSQEMLLKYLSQSNSLTNILEENFQDLIFDILCDRKTEKIINHLKSLELSEEYKDLEYTDFEEISEEFVYSFVNRTFVSVFLVQFNICKETQNNQKKKLVILKQQAGNMMKYFTKVFNKISLCAEKILEETIQISQKIQFEAISQHDEENKDKQEKTNKSKDKFIAFQSHLNNIVTKHNKFFDFIHIFVASLVSDKHHEMTMHLNNLLAKTIQIVKQMGRYCDIDSKSASSSLQITENHCHLRNYISKDLMKFLIWSLSKVAHSFIKVEEEKVDEEIRTHQNLFKSRLLSGGIENRFLNCFSKEASQIIESLAIVTNDNKLIQYLSKSELISEDEDLLAIIHEGRNKSIDKLLELLQWNLSKKNPNARVGGKEGMNLSRCAFACILSLNQHEDNCSYTNFLMMIDQLEMSLDSIDDSLNLNQKNKQLMDEINELEGIQPILDRWEISSKMRIWLQEKRKDISNKVRKDFEVKKAKREQEQKTLEEIKSKSAQDQEKDTKEANDEETIDTSSKADPQNNDFTAEDIVKEEQIQISELIQKVIEKAELLIKLSTPASWDHPENSNKNLRNIDGYEEDKLEAKDEDLSAKLQRIRTIQESEGTITNFENLSNKAVFNTCSSSVLASLQCKISAKRILSRIENKYILTMKRLCGLKIFGEISSCSMSDDTKTSCFNWFCSALRKNSNILAHYSDDLTGMGDYLLDKLRVSFFDVFNGIVGQIRHTNDINIMKFLLNCAKWRISATDHQYIVKSGIIQTLKDGNGSEDKLKNPIKYCWGNSMDFENIEQNETLSHVVVESLEFIMMACFARILGEGDDRDLSMKKTGSSIEKIQQAYSVVNTNITEVLLASCFEIIFEKMESSLQNIKRKLNEDGKTEEEKNKSSAEENKEPPKQSEEDLKSEFDDKVMLKLLRLLEIFTAIAVKSKEIKQFVIQVTRPIQILSLANLLMKCKWEHGIIILKIISNLIVVGLESSTIDEAFGKIKSTPQGKEICEVHTQTKFDDCPFIEYLYKLLLKIRSSQWDKWKFETSGSYNISCGIIKVFRNLMRTTHQPYWRTKIMNSMDEFIANIDTYSIEEFDVLISLFEGGEYNGLNTGAYGKTQDNNLFTTVGFVKNWYELSTPDGQAGDSNFDIKPISNSLENKDQYLLAIYYDEKHPQRNDMFLAYPEQVTLIPHLSKGSDEYFLDKTRLNNFINAMELDKFPNKKDSTSLTKR